MKNLIFYLVLFISIPAYSQTSDCLKYRDGKFLMEDLEMGKTHIERKGKIQIEFMEYTGLKIKFKVKWLDDCTYTLKVLKILENPREYPVPKKMVVQVKIMEINKDGYIQQTTTKGSDYKMTSEMRKVD